MFLGLLALWTVANGLLPLLPVYARQLGFSASAIGVYLSLSYVALALGTACAGWLADRFERRRTTAFLCGLADALLLATVGVATAWWQLTAITAAAFALGGMCLAFLLALAGLSVDPAERGRIFGTLALTAALGTVLGGLTIGPLADAVGYPATFPILAAVWAVLPLSTLLTVEGPPERGPPFVRVGRRQGFDRPLFLLLVASTIGGTASFLGILGRSLAMVLHGYGSTAISFAAAVGGAVAVPLTFLAGSLSDRVARKPLLALCYVAGMGGLGIFALAGPLWQFWLGSVLLAVLTNAGYGVGQAWAADLVPPEFVGRGLSSLTSTIWIGGILGFSLTGFLVEASGTAAAFSFGLGLLVFAAVLLLPIRGARMRIR